MRVGVGPVRVEPGDPEQVAVARLLREAEAYAHSLYVRENVHLLPVQRLGTAAVRFLVARSMATGAVVGCGAVVLQPDVCAELKWMFVDPSARRQGVGAEILRALEAVARAQGVRVMRLETGVRQPEAIALYRRFQYRRCDRFGDYPDDPRSIFMEKVFGRG